MEHSLQPKPSDGCIRFLQRDKKPERLDSKAAPMRTNRLFLRLCRPEHSKANKWRQKRPPSWKHAICQLVCSLIGPRMQPQIGTRQLFLGKN